MSCIGAMILVNDIFTFVVAHLWQCLQLFIYVIILLYVWQVHFATYMLVETS